MKKSLFILPILFATLHGHSQNFKTSVFVSPNISWISSSSEKIKSEKTGRGFSVAVREEYYFSKLFSIGSEIEYMNIGASFQSPDNQPAVGEVVHYTRNTIRENIVEVPLIIKIRSKNENKNLYCFTGLGLSYHFSNKKAVEVISYSWHNSDEKQVKFITKGNFDFSNKSKLGSFILFGVGKNFIIKKKKLFSELRFRHDLTSWVYPTTNDPVDPVFNIRTNTITLNIGYIF